MTRDMRSVSFGRAGMLHIEAPGCIVNITKGLSDSEGRAVTSVEVIADGDRLSGEPQWWLPDFPCRAGMNVRVVQMPKPEPAPEPDAQHLAEAARGLLSVIGSQFGGDTPDWLRKEVLALRAALDKQQWNAAVDAALKPFIADTKLAAVMADLSDLVGAAQQVVEDWESSDLQHAVNALDDAADDIAKRYGLAQVERPEEDDGDGRAKPERVEIGKRYRFNYPVQFVTLPDYTAHAGQFVTVLRQLEISEADQETEAMFKVIAADGWSGDAHESELGEEAGPIS